MVNPSSPGRQQPRVIGCPFVAVIPDQVRAYGPEAALVLSHLAYLTTDEPAVVASTAALADGTGLAPRTVQRVTARLRTAGLLYAERASSWDPTLRWQVLIGAGQSVDATMAVTRAPDQVVSLPATLAVTPSHPEAIDTPPTSPPDDEQTELPLLTVVPTAGAGPDHDAEFTRFWDLWPSGRKVGKPKALLAYRSARKRGAAVEQIAAGLHAHLPAWSARITAGESGFVPHPTTWLNRDGWNDEPPRQASRARANVFADPSMGGPDAAGMERFRAMMAADQPRALGGGA